MSVLLQAAVAEHPPYPQPQARWQLAGATQLTFMHGMHAMAASKIMAACMHTAMAGYPTHPNSAAQARWQGSATMQVIFILTCIHTYMHA
jgi:hypothetical protein